VRGVTEGYWRALLRDASQLRAAGRIPEAIAAYRDALGANPDLPDSWFNLGWLQRQVRAFESALDSYQRALDLGIAKPEEVHVNRAAILSECLHRPRDAQRELRAALGKNPDYTPALVNLGNLHEDLGEAEEARAAYRRALQIDPGATLPLARLAACSLSSELDSELAARLRARIDEPSATNTQRAGLGFALAAMLDAAGEYDQAFAAVAAANDASRAAAGSKGVYDRANQEQFVDRLIATFDRPPSDAEAGPSPVFICGMYRSGSTLVEQILAGHSGVVAGGELDLVPALVASVAGYPEPFASADAAVFARAREFYLAGLPEAPGARIVTDKRPDNFLHLGLIKSMFPAAKIIHTARNPLDNLLSLYFLHLDASSSYALDLADAAHWYGQYQRLMRHWAGLYGDDMLEVDYDALVRDPEPAVKEITRFLGLEWEDSLLDFARTDRAVKTASVWQVREPLYTRSSGRWRNYETHLQPLRSALAEAGIATDE
jgi:tetratricopeptide (TPR) repeat protein